MKSTLVSRRIRWLAGGLFICVLAVPRVYGESRGYLGIAIERLSNMEKKEMNISHGILITDVEPESPAEEAGIQEEDVMLYYNGRKLRRTDQLIEWVRETEPETMVKITVLRGKSRKDLDVQIGRYSPPLARVIRTGRDSWFISGGVYMGVTLHDMDPDLAAYFNDGSDPGALILDVADDSPARDAGIKAGDVIVRINGEDVGDARDVSLIMDEFDEGETIEVDVIRHQRKVTLKVELRERPGGGNFMIYGGDGIKIIGDMKHRMEDIKKSRKEFEMELQERQTEKLNEIFEIHPNAVKIHTHRIII